MRGTLDGRRDAEVWSLEASELSSSGFAGVPVAVSDIDGAQSLETVALNDEGDLVMVDAQGGVQRIVDRTLERIAGDGCSWSAPGDEVKALCVR